MKLQDITKTLHTDLDTQETYLKIPLSDLSELSAMQQSLLENLHLLSQLEKETDLKDCVFWLSRILLASYPSDELEGVAKLIKAASKLL